ncbi:MAG: hypothetical protein J1E42_03405 [Akkermansiaceae bacterium]|nr:hypothetical protein [Akkermansiaceae bacterium]
MRAATESIRRVMRQRLRATCPELAEATGLSLVTIHREVEALCRGGELRALAEATTRGGRPARVYALEARFAERAFLRLRLQAGVLQGELEVADLEGVTLRRSCMTYASLSEESLDGWLDEALCTRGSRVLGLAVAAEPWAERRGLQLHLQRRYHFPVEWLSPAEALADEHEDTATIYLPRGEAPLCSMRRYGRAIPAGSLALLPMPAAWSDRVYGDRTLMAEMVARLLHILTCVLAPQRVVAHADFWTPRLIERIRYSTHSKQRGQEPELVFRVCSEEQALAAVRARALRLRPCVVGAAEAAQSCQRNEWRESTSASPT